MMNVQASLPLSQGHHCPCCTGTIVNIAQALLLLLGQRHCHYPADFFALRLHGCCHRPGTSVVAPVELACLRHGVWVKLFKAATVCQLTAHMDSISMCSNTL
jgi:hypothetical protein